MTRWLAALAGITLMLVCDAHGEEIVGSLRPIPNCDLNYGDCSRVARVYTTSEVDRAIRNAVEYLGQKYDRELSDLKATVAAQSQEIAELRERAGLRQK